MSEQTFLVLTALADEPMHGYGIVRAAEEVSAGEVHLRVGTLYGALDRLVADGLVEHASTYQAGRSTTNSMSS